MISMPGRSHVGPLPELTVEEIEIRHRLQTHIEMLAGTIGERNVFASQYPQLRKAEAYIRKQFDLTGYKVEEQVFKVFNRDVCNIEATLTGVSEKDEILIVGAHYDAVVNSPAANDNASGVAGILEIARLLYDRKPARTVRFVAFVNEEPPFFQTKDMGSLVYAKNTRQQKDNIIGMISLETIGYYSDTEGGQKYPFPFSLFYPSVGNFIGLVGNLGSRSLVRNSIGLFRKHTAFPSEGVAAPGFIPGIDWSDHWSFWQQGYKALMVTDTAPYRYPYYHTQQDTPDKIDYDRTARVVAGLAHMVFGLASTDEPD
ncbi:MAG: M28 family peptidase [Planctomycetota bacterium]|nr:MAG: M28 family peptidase [Planctomycetota bacterium]